MLGTAVQAQHNALIMVPGHLIPTQCLVTDAYKRLRLADVDADLITQIVETITEQPLRYAARLMLVRSLAVGLDIGMRILPAEVLSPIVTALTWTVLQVACAVTSLCHLTDALLAQAQLPRQYGGMFLTSPSIKLQVAYSVSLAASWRLPYHWLHQGGLRVTAAFTSTDMSRAANLLEDLHTYNVWIHVFSAPCAGQHSDGFSKGSDQFS